MVLSNRRGLKQQAMSALSSAGYNHRQLVLLHTGGILAVNLVLSLLLYAIGGQVSETGGLGGMQVRAFWATLENLLMVLIPAAILFWDASYYHIAIGFARGQRMTPRDLLAGFRHPVSVLGCNLWPAVQYVARGFLCMFLASILFSMTPQAQPLMAAIEQLPTQLVDGQLVYVMDEATQALIMENARPMLAIAAALFIPLALPLYYRLRLGMYLLLDGQETGCLNALRGSRWRMRGRRLEMFRLDLSFWWYYLLQCGATAICYLDTWLPALGVQLPGNSIALGIGTYLLYAVCQLALDLWAKNPVLTTYAVAYDAILNAGNPLPQQ